MATFLVISDIHGSRRFLNKIRSAFHKYDPEFSIVCGDITHFGSIDDAVDILEKIPTKILGVTGNCDPQGTESAFEKTDNHYLELKRVRKKKLEFIGLSGSDYSQKKIEMFRKRSEGADVFVFHQPPYRYLDETSKGTHIGNEDLVPVVEELEPKLVLSGHVHEDRGVVRDKGTVFMNPGPARHDNLGLVKMEDGEVNAKLI